MKEVVEVKVNKNLGTIDSNLDAVKASIESYIKDYENYAVSEDTVKDSKKLVSDLRKQQKALDAERMHIKKDWNAPFTEWEKKAKDVIALYDKPILLINDQLLKFEEDRKSKKRADIRVAYVEVVDAIDMNNELEDYCPIEKIYDSKWENASVSMKSIKEEIQQKLEAVGMQIDTIRSMESEFEDKGLEEFKKTLNLQSAVQLMNQYKKQKEEILARQEEERKAKEERERLEAERAEKERIAAEQRAAEEKAEAERHVVAVKEEPFPDLPEMEEDPFVEPEVQEEIPFAVDGPFEDEQPFGEDKLSIRVECPASRSKELEDTLNNMNLEWRYM